MTARKRAAKKKSQKSALERIEDELAFETARGQDAEGVESGAAQAAQADQRAQGGLDPTPEGELAPETERAQQRRMQVVAECQWSLAVTLEPAAEAEGLVLHTSRGAAPAGEDAIESILTALQCLERFVIAHPRRQPSHLIGAHVGRVRDHHSKGCLQLRRDRLKP